MDDSRKKQEPTAPQGAQQDAGPDTGKAADRAPETAPSAGGRQDAAAVAEQKSPEKPRDPVQELRDELKTLQDKYLRVLAEFDNYKRRTARERQQLVESANAGLMLDLTEVRENLERALKTGAASAPAGPVFDGMRLIYQKFDEILGRHGLEPYGGEGEEFDPALHDAMMRAPHASVPEGHVAQVVEVGYRLKGQVLKHARVVVSAGAPTQPAAQEQPAHQAETKE